MTEQYRTNIEAILKNSDLSTITTKKIRKELEAQIGTSLDHVKKEINTLIEQVFLSFQQQASTSSQDSERVLKKKDTSIKKTTAPTIKKETKKKKQQPKKPIDWPVYKVTSPLSDIIGTDICSRPQTVKKMWEYIRKHNLQSETDKRIINCDDKFKLLCDNLEQVSAFTINKYTQKYFEKIPAEEQANYKKILQDREELQK
ncbi:SWIB/MDM2 domain-containing protein [Cokeromyces recurvatus]|uniref:SWIB/MDM2 domain-containing protein n=1 Tax=Cokeromyces recurvatus TaxID=90255 RepID=UPI0022203B2A|nr:SWIB/MDM2 domain-containing protein [Cokeromyces recurvatus]KAI7907403.1 SWIB/MDM2 domain-containing protein [Cokeromyces recurvatus]